MIISRIKIHFFLTCIFIIRKDFFDIKFQIEQIRAFEGDLCNIFSMFFWYS